MVVVMIGVMMVMIEVVAMIGDSGGDSDVG